MSRSRNLKPGFFKNDLLAELPFEFRLLFAGLWTIADREGRLEDRPVKIRMEVFPADAVDVNAGLSALQDKGFIKRYSFGEVKYIQILAWSKHQNPHVKEVASTIPAPCENSSSTIPAPEIPAPAGLIPSSLIPDSLSTSTAQQAARFAEFWKVYPKKRAKKVCLAKWKARRLDSMADLLIADVRNRIANDERWIRGYPTDPLTYLNQDRWEDEIGRSQQPATPKISGAHKPYVPERRERVTAEPTAMKDLMAKLGLGENP